MEEDSSFQINLEYPVSIEAILSVSFNLEGFKSVFEFILQTLRRHESLFKSHSQKLSSLSSSGSELEGLISRLSSAESSISSLDSSQRLSEQEIQTLKDFRTASEKFSHQTNERLENLESSLKSVLSSQDSLDDLKRLVAVHEEALKEANRFIENLNNDVFDLSSKNDRTLKHSQETREKLEHVSHKVQDHEKRIHQLEMDMNQAIKAISSLGGEFEQLARAEPPAEVPHEVVQVVDNSKVDFLEDSLKDLLKKLADLEARLRSVEDSASKSKLLSERLEAFTKGLEAEIKNLKGHKSSSLPSTAGTGASSNDIDELRALCSSLDGKISTKLSSADFESKYQDLLQRIDDLSSKARTLESSITKRVLKSELDDLLRSLNQKVAPASDPYDASKLTSLSKRVGAVEEALIKLALPQGYDLVMVVNIILKMQQETKEIREKTDKNYKDLWAKIREIEEILAKKAGLDKLKELEEMLLAKIKELVDDFLKRFADKSEMKRGLKYLEKLIRESESIKVVKDGDDAMLARKPLGGWSCASCQKDLEKLIGKIAPYHAWNKMPYRDPADRIARVGPGFSRMLATVQPEMLTGRGKNSMNSPNAGEEDEYKAFPPVKKGNDRPFTSL